MSLILLGIFVILKRKERHFGWFYVCGKLPAFKGGVSEQFHRNVKWSSIFPLPCSQGSLSSWPPLKEEEVGFSCPILSSNGILSFSSCILKLDYKNLHWTQAGLFSGCCTNVQHSPGLMWSCTPMTFLCRNLLRPRAGQENLHGLCTGSLRHRQKLNLSFHVE